MRLLGSHEALHLFASHFKLRSLFTVLPSYPPQLSTSLVLGISKHHSAPGSPATCRNLPQPATRQLAAQARHLSAGGVGQAAVLPDLGHGRVASAGDGHSDTTECCRSWGKKHPDAIAKILRLRTSWNGFDPCWYGKLRGLTAQLRSKEIAGGTQHLSLQRCHQRVPEV